MLEDDESLSGTLITASANVAVVSGNVAAVVGASGRVDNLLEQVPPVSAWGRDYYTMPLLEGHEDGQILIVVAEDYTTITLSGSRSETLANYHAGNVVSRPVSYGTSLRITADKPILVAQLSNSVGSGTIAPAMVILPAVEQYLASYTFSIPSSEDFSGYVLITADSAVTSDLRLDNSVLDSSGWTTVPGTTMRSRAQFVATGEHVIRSDSNRPFGAYVFGYSSGRCSFAYTAGSCETRINSVVSLQPIFVVNTLMNEQNAAFFHSKFVLNH